MGNLNPEKLFVEFRQGVTPIEPIIRRRYTLTHSDITAELFLTIGEEFALDKINEMRDEVIAEWRENKKGYYFFVYLYVDGKNNFIAKIRDNIFRRELPLALEAIRYGDSKFFQVHKELDHVPIIIKFYSPIQEYNSLENWGSFSQYNNRSNSKEIKLV